MRLLIIPLLALLAGCGTLGNEAKAPGRFEETFFTVTNVPMLTVHTLTNVVNVTNFVPREVVTVKEVTVTNAQQQIVPIFVTITNTVQVPEVSTQTNIIPAGSTVLVPQLTGRTGTGDAVIGVGGAVGGLWGVGGLVVAALSGIGNWWQRSRNRALAASYTGASATANAMQQTSAALAQQIETLLEVLNQTPQGQSIAPAVKQFLVKHQAETGTLTTVMELIKDEVDNESARNAAGEILDSVKALRDFAQPTKA